MNKLALIALAIVFMTATPMFARMPAAHSDSTATLSVSPASRVISTLTGNFNLTIHVDSVSNLWSWKVNVTWDPTVLTLTSNPAEGSFMSSAGPTFFIAAPARSGQIPEISDSFTITTSVNGSGDLAYLTFRAVNASNYNYASGGSQVNITSTVMLDPAYNNIAYTSTNCTVHVAVVGDITGVGPAFSFVPDGKVDGKDIALVAKCFGSYVGCSPPLIYNVNCDLFDRGKIDGKDLATVAKNFGQHYP
jgi:hypothetical protein